MKSRVIAIVTLSFLCIPQVALTEEIGIEDLLKIRLICAYESSWNLKTGERSETVGEDLVTIYSLKETDPAAIAISGERSRQMKGALDETEITGTVEWGDKVKLREDIKINRFTGKFSIDFYALGEIAVVHYGKCRSVDKPKF